MEFRNIRAKVKFIIRKLFNTYYISCNHYADGYDDYDEECYKRSEKEILKILRKLINKKIIPRVGEELYLYSESLFYIKAIVYYDTHISFWVDEEKNRNLD